MNSSTHYIPKGVTPEHFGNVTAFEVPATDILAVVRELHSEKFLSLKLIDATDERAAGEGFKIWYVFGVPGKDEFITAFVRLGKAEEFVSVASVVQGASGYERKISALFGLTPDPDLDPRRIILHENWPENAFPLRKDFDAESRPKTAEVAYPFQEVQGEGIYEISVGPIHAGIIGPGHFRFSVAGEEIMLLEPRLGYTHKGSEKLFEQLNLDGQVRLSEKVSGDSSFGHSLAFCQAIEALSGVAASERAMYLRVMFAELERLANHFGDIGAIMLDTGFNFGGSQGARLREMIVQLCGQLAGSRFLRGVNVPGGVTRDISGSDQAELARELDRIARDFAEVIGIAENSILLLNRLKGAGVLPPEVAKDFGAVGVAARAVGLAVDVRIDHPYAAYAELGPAEAAVESAGDVYARFRVRVKEALASIKLVQAALKGMPDGPVLAKLVSDRFEPNAVAVGCVEGWRGEIVYFVKTDEGGKISRVAVRDPSFINWQVVAYCATGQMVPDFPLINKSYNLSYSGNDV